jgi:LacI family transcriptional regulator
MQPITLIYFKKSFFSFTFQHATVCIIKRKEVTIYDLAHKLNISVATVSRALKDNTVVTKKTRKKISDPAEAMGYRSNHFARNLRQQQTNTIGIIVHELNSNFITSVLAR